MKARHFAVIMSLGAAFSMPVAAHHNCAAGDSCPDEIGDVQGNHEAAINGLPDNMGGGVPDNTAAMDPADSASAVPDDRGGLDPNQSSGPIQ